MGFLLLLIGIAGMPGTAANADTPAPATTAPYANEQRFCGQAALLEQLQKRTGRLPREIRIARGYLRDSGERDAIAASDCTSRGCRYLVYENENGCYRAAGEMRGEIEILDERANGRRVIRVTRRGDPPSEPLVREYRFSTETHAYIESK